MSYFWAIVVAGGVLVLTTLTHYEAIRWLGGWSLKHRSRGRFMLLTITMALVLVHLFEITVYAGAFALAAHLGLGDIQGSEPTSARDYFHFAAEAYASLGSADMSATGDTRLIAAISPLNGILLLAWSGAFLFSLVDTGHRPSRPDRRD